MNFKQPIAYLLFIILSPLIGVSQTETIRLNFSCGDCPEVDIFPKNAVICPNGELELNAKPKDAYEDDFEYIWSKDNIQNKTLLISQPGVYSVTVTDKKGSCEAIAEVTVKEFSESNLIEYFESNYFEKTSILVKGEIGLRSPNKTSRNSRDIIDYAEVFIELNGEEINLKEKLESFYGNYNSCSRSYESIITKDVCMDISVEDLIHKFESGFEENVNWFHIIDNPEGEDILYYGANSKKDIVKKELGYYEQGDYTTWAPVYAVLDLALFDAPDFKKNDYFTTDGEYLGSGHSNSEVRIVNITKDEIPDGSLVDNLPFYLENSNFISKWGGTKATTKIGQFYYDNYLCGHAEIIASTASLQAGNNIAAAGPIRKKGERRCSVNNIDRPEERIWWTTCPNIGIAIGVGASGLISEFFNNKNDFINLLEHEEYHFSNEYYKAERPGCNCWHWLDTNLDGNDKSRKQHLVGAYWTQVNGQTYENITTDFERDVKESITDFINAIEDTDLKKEMQDLFDPFLNFMPNTIEVTR